MNLTSTDINQDGKDDLVVLHDGWDIIGHYEQVAGQLGPEGGHDMLDTTAASYPWDAGLAMGDLNGDGCPDAVVASNRGLVFLHGRGCVARADLLASLGLTATTVAVRIDNMGPGAATAPGFILKITSRDGSLTTVDAPAGCTKQVVGATHQFTCALGTFEPGTAQTATFGLSVPSGRANTVSASLVVSTPSVEVTLSNNRAWKQVGVGKPPGSMPITTVTGRR